MPKGFMHGRLKQGVFLLIGLLVLLTLIWPSATLPSLIPDNQRTVSKVPDFTHFKVVSEKKEAFFEFLYPLVEEENLHILDIRRHLKQLHQNPSLSSDEVTWVNLLSSAYLKESEQDQTIEKRIVKLLGHIDIVPPSMVLAQAAIESAWGTSRFAIKGNNLFGQWCFEPGCGIVPASRTKGKQHEVARFATVNESVRAYLNNLNRFSAYKDFRKTRRSLRHKQTTLTVSPLLPGLNKYSEQGEQYLAKISRVIRQNKLERFDKRFTTAKETKLR